MLSRSLRPAALSDDPSNGGASSSCDPKGIERLPVATQWSEADFQKRLGMLLAMDEGVKTLAVKLYHKFHGQSSKLPVILQLLQEKWGFPDRLFPLLDTHLRRAVCRCRGTYDCAQVGSEDDIPEQIEENEWVEAFWKWLESVHARCGQVKLTRRSMVRQHSSLTGSEVLEEYIQGHELGAGCFGTVHVAFHKALGVSRAVKVIDKALMGVSQERAEDEVNILKSLDHPHIVRIYETVDIEEQLHIVMDYAEGGDLAKVLKDVSEQSKTLSADWSRAVAQQITGALEYIHSKGVIHCDLKPANAMLMKPVDLCTEEPHIVLVDFGISEIFEDRQIATRMQIRGTAPYLSPDAFEGEYTDKSDMWALGVMIFEMLLGRRPFSAVRPVLLSIQVATREPPIDELPLSVQEVMRGLLAKDPITRLSAKECRALEWFSKGCTQLSTSIQRKMTPVQSLRHVNYFHQSAMFCVASGLSMKDMKEVLQAFQAIDTDKSGRLSLQQFAKGLQLMGIEGDPEALMAILDLDKNGYISYTEFLAGMISTREDVAEPLIRDAFSVFDLDGDGVLSMHELRVMLSGDGPLIEVLPDGQTVDEVMEEVGNGQGVISVEDFLSYIRKAATTTRKLVDPISPALLPSVRRLQSEVHVSNKLSELTLSPKSRVQSESVAHEMIKDVETNLPGEGAMGNQPHQKVSQRPSLCLGGRASQLHKISLPPLHRWLSDVCGEDPELDVISRFLMFPEEPLDPSFVAQHIGILRKHFSAGISLAHSLVQGKGKDGKALRKAVSAAADVWGRVGSASPQHCPVNPIARKETRTKKPVAKDSDQEDDILRLPPVQQSSSRDHHELEAVPHKVKRQIREDLRQAAITPQLLLDRGAMMLAPQEATERGAKHKRLRQRRSNAPSRKLPDIHAAAGIDMIGHYYVNRDARPGFPSLSGDLISLPAAGHLPKLIK